MSRCVWFNCSSGIAGDMALGALIDAGAEAAYVMKVLESLPIIGWTLEAEKTVKTGISATRLTTAAIETQPHRSLHDIVPMFDGLEPRIRERATAVFTALAHAEAKVHDTSVDHVHFHEVGAIDAIIDIVGTCAALENLSIDAVYASPPAMGTGTVTSEHGSLPSPPPAVVELLKNSPVFGVNLPYEMTTPTGAAIVVALSTNIGPMPQMRIESSGYGAGTREIENMPNCTQAIVGELATTEPALDKVQHDMLILETNIDDATGEVLAHTISRMLGAGAKDAWITPITMKKGRPAHTVSILAEAAKTNELIELLQAETGTLGVRAHHVNRFTSERHVDYVDLDGEHIRIKVGKDRAKPEFDDAVRAATNKNRPVREIISEAEQIWKQSQG